MDPSIAALAATIEHLGKQIERLIDADRADHDALTRIDRDLRQAFIEIKNLRTDFLAEQKASIQRCESHASTCALRSVRSADEIRADERAIQEDRDWREKVIARINAQDAKWAVVQTQAAGVGKFALTVLGSGAGGGVAVKVFEWIAAWWGTHP